MKTETETEKQEELREILGKIPPPVNEVFSLQKLKEVSVPHPYCITPRHVRIAANNFSGILSRDAIEEAEECGIFCDICRENGNIIPFDKHETLLTLFVLVPKEHQKNLNNCPGLHSYLLSIKQQAETLGIKGLAFPSK